MKYILLSLLFSFTINANAQHILKGNVIDRTNKEIPYLNIRVLTADSTFVYGTITDSIGNFSLKGIQPGSYLLVTSCIGYIPLYTPILMPDKDLQIPPIIMEDENGIFL